MVLKDVDQCLVKVIIFISKSPNPPAFGYGRETDAPFYRIITEVYVPNESIESYEKQWGKTYFLKYLPIEDLKNE